MKYASLVGPDKKPYFVRLKDGTATPIARAYEQPGLDPLREILESGRDPARMRAIAKPFPLQGAKYLPAVTAPQKVIGAALNYYTHAAEFGLALKKTEPASFCKYNSALLGHDETIRYRRSDSIAVDYECELAIVMGKRARNVARKDALNYVFGYTICNDVSARDHQLAEGQFARAKSFDTFSPLGPVIVTADEIPNPQRVMCRTRVNGVVRQEESTADMVFSCKELISYLSRFMTLEPADVISTGTMAGVGLALSPFVFLTNGTTVECEIEGIGVLRNKVKVLKNLKGASRPPTLPKWLLDRGRPGRAKTKKKAAGKKR